MGGDDGPGRGGCFVGAAAGSPVRLLVEATVAVAVGLYSGQKLNEKVNRVAIAAERIAGAQETLAAAAVASALPAPDPQMMIYICKRMPHLGQRDWVEWVARHGECGQVY